MKAQRTIKNQFIIFLVLIFVLYLYLAATAPLPLSLIALVLLLIIINEIRSGIILPLMKVFAVVRRVEKGDVKERFKDHCDGEIARLGYSFNAIVDELVTTRKKLARAQKQVEQLQGKQKKARKA